MVEAVHRQVMEFVRNEQFAEVLAVAALLAVLVSLAMLANWLTKKLIDVYVSKIVERTGTRWDNIIFQHKVFTRLSHLVPIIVIGIGARLCFSAPGYETLLDNLSRFVSLYAVLTIAWVISSLLTALVDIYRTYEISKARPINSYVQMLKIILWVFAGLATVSILLNKDLWGLFLGLGGLMAVILLVFRDSILGLVAGMQIAANDMLRLDDWLEMPSRGADGDVIEITLNTVKVRNWDKTITTIPTHALISESFKNWRGMTESGGRRIKRSIAIDMNTVSFCSEEMLDAFMKIQVLKDYLISKQKEIGTYNEQLGVDTGSLANGRRITNLGTFRAYLIAYLKNHPDIRQDMTFLVRQLPPGPTGLPVEIYVFSSVQEWASYEAIQADIFDHVLAVLPEFGLRVFQNPTGADFARGLT